MCGIPYMWNLKRNDTNKLLYKIEIENSQTLKTNLELLGEIMGRKDS